MRLHQALIGGSLLVIFIAGIMSFMTEGVQKYNSANIPTNINDSMNRLSDKVNDLNSASINNSTSALAIKDGNAGVTDYLGFYFGQAYKSGKVIVSGLLLGNDVVNEASTSIFGYSSIGNVIKYSLLGIIAIIILAMLLHFAIKSEWI